jgi:hypothetical protein
MTTTTDGCQKGTINLKILLTVYNNGSVEPITGATNLQIIFERPDKTWFAKTAYFETDGSDGKLYYTTQSKDDLNMAGTWNLQAKFTLSGWTGPSTVETLKVYENVEDEG